MKRILLFMMTLSSLYGWSEQEARKLMVTGHAVVTKPPEKVSISIGVTTFDKDAKKAIKANAEKMNLVVKKLATLGLKDHEIQTGNFSVTPQEAVRPKNAPLEWQPFIEGYEVRNILAIHTTNLAWMEKIIEITTKEGANVIQDLSFSLKDESQAKAEAISQAVIQAENYGQAAAKQAYARLGHVIELSINAPFVTPRFLKTETMALAAGQNASTPILSGNVEVTASVSIVYRLID